jgi:hypothetical protein
MHRAFRATKNVILRKSIIFNILGTVFVRNGIGIQFAAQAQVIPDPEAMTRNWRLSKALT